MVTNQEKIIYSKFYQILSMWENFVVDDVSCWADLGALNKFRAPTITYSRGYIRMIDGIIDQNIRLLSDLAISSKLVLIVYVLLICFV